jgi:hypothetical protein
MKGWMERYLKSTQHGNFHFHSGDVITFKKQGKLLLRLRDLELVYYLLTIQSRQEGKDEYYYWRKFNSDIQKVIDDKVNELDPPSAKEE